MARADGRQHALLPDTQFYPPHHYLKEKQSFGLEEEQPKLQEISLDPSEVSMLIERCEKNLTTKRCPLRLSLRPMLQVSVSLLTNGTFTKPKALSTCL